MRISNLFISTVLGMLLMGTGTVSASTLFFEPDTAHSGPGFTIQVMLGLEREVNALEGEVHFDAGVLRAARILESPSGVPLWIEGPSVSSEGVISFAGMFPGGIGPVIADRIPLMTITFEVVASGRTSLSVENVRVLLNEPAATEDDVQSISMEILLDDTDRGIPSEIEDYIPPEAFDVQIIRDAPLENEVAVAVFQARDLQSGVAKYEMRERFLGLFGTFEETQSPTVLSAKWPWSIIEVRAIDHAGHATVSRHVPFVLIVTYVLLAGFLLSWGVRRSLRSRR